VVCLLFGGRWSRRLLGAALLLTVLLFGLWVAIHHIPGFGPWLADTARSVAGPKAVAWVEDKAYGMEDWVNLHTRQGEKPEAYWPVPSGTGSAGAKVHRSERQAREDAPGFQPRDVGPALDSFSAPGDGVWVGMADAQRPREPNLMAKTLLHPDRSRSWAVVAVVAVDLRQAELHLVAGKQEPESHGKEAAAYERKALVAPADLPRLLAAFNGGYKATHGTYGMKVDGVTLVPPRSLCCAIASYPGGKLAIGSWEKLAADEPTMSWWRQAPLCMFEDGKPNPVLELKGFGWGASSVSGTTVIRRSAIGLDERGKTLFVGIGDHTTASAIAHAMHHAGASNVAQLDVNFSFPKFVTFAPREPGASELVAVPLTEHFEFGEDDYVRTPAPRDFFYLTRRAEPGS
jgi:hypothetical protein